MSNPNGNPLAIVALSTDCRRFDKDGKEVGKPHKPFNLAKKPWKKGGGDSGQMAYLTKKLEKLE